MRSKRSLLLIAIALIALLLASALPLSFAGKLKPVPDPTATITLNKVDVRNNLFIVSASWSGYDDVYICNIEIVYDPNGWNQIVGVDYYDNVANSFVIKRDNIFLAPDVMLDPNSPVIARLTLRDSTSGVIVTVDSVIKYFR